MMKGIFKRIKRRLKYTILTVTENIKIKFSSNYIVIEGWGFAENFGDALNVYIIEELSGKKVIHKKFLNNKNVEAIACIGSIIQWADNNSLIWGAGLIKDTSPMSNSLTLENIKAVRGYKTIEVLRKNGYYINNIPVGDPALLLPKLYKKEFNKGTNIGILPHYTDKNHPWIEKVTQANKQVKFIDIECGKDIDGFLQQLNSCEIIISSSLHGLILADAYGIKNLWVKFGNSIDGSNFKFQDYYSSIHQDIQTPVQIYKETELEKLLSLSSAKKIKLDLDALYNSCPFKK